MRDRETESDDAGVILGRVAAEFDDTVPNVYRTLARHTAALDAFVQVERILEERGILSRAEQAVVALEVAVHNDCGYCQRVFSREAAESGIASQCVENIIRGQPPQAPRLAALVEAAGRIMARHGDLGLAEITVFEERGVSLEELLEITTIISAYTLATYANNLARTRVDPEYRRQPD